MRAIRVERGWSQADLAAALPSSPHLSWVSKVELGQLDVGASDIPMLASALGVAVGWLVTGEASGDSEFIARLKGLEAQLDRRGRNAVLAIAQQQVDDAE